MRTQTLKSEAYEIEYRVPNVIQAMKMVSRIGLTPDDLSGGEGGIPAGRELEVMVSLMETTEQYVVSIKKDDKDLSWDDAVYDASFLAVLTELGSTLLSSLQGQGDSEAKK